MIKTSPYTINMQRASYREIKFTARLLGIIVRLCSQISEEILSRLPPDRAARAPHAVHPAAPGASAPGAGEHCTKTLLHADCNKGLVQQ